jgi:hypothetical protein
MTRPEQSTLSKAALASEDASVGWKTKAALGVGILLVAMTLLWSGSLLRATQNMTSADGAVVRFDDNGHLRSYRPVIRFTNALGEQREAVGPTSSSQPDYDIGQHVHIFYDAADPQRAVVIDDFEQRWFPVVVMAVLSIAWCAIAGGVYIAERRAVLRGASSQVARPVGQRKRQLDRQAVLITVIPIVIGAGLILGAGASLLHERHVIQRFSRARGEVVDIKRNRVPYKPTTNLRSAVVVFKTDTGREIAFAQGSSTSHSGYQEGDTVDVLYDPTTPERAMIDSFWDHWGVAIILFVIGLPFFAIGVFFAMTVDFHRGRSRAR